MGILAHPLDILSYFSFRKARNIFVKDLVSINKPHFSCTDTIVSLVVNYSY